MLPEIKGADVLTNKRLIVVCVTIVILTAIAAVQFRYKTYNKADLTTVVYDRWTGDMRLCDLSGCFTEEELRSFAEARFANSQQEATNRDIYIETPLGVNLVFPAQTPAEEVAQIVAGLDACGERAETQIDFEKCYRPDVRDQADGVGYRLNGTPFRPRRY